MKKNYHHGNLKEILMTEAPILINKVGIEKFGLRQLARDAGVSHAAVYKHFVDKRALLAALAIEGYKKLVNAIRLEASGDKKPCSKLTALSLIYYRWFSENSAEYEVIFGPRLNEDGIYSELEEAIETVFSLIDETFRELGMNTARSREYTVSMVTILHGYCDMVRLKRIRVSSQEAAEDYLMINIRPILTSLDC